MHHAAARQVVARILAGDGFGVQAVAAVHAALLHDAVHCPPDIQRAVVDAIHKEPPDQVAVVAHPLNQQPVPADERQLCRQLAPIITAHPADPAQAASGLWALCRLWPHVGGDERPQLRARFINSLVAGVAEPGAALGQEQLREWQKRVPTSYGGQAPSLASLRTLLDAKDPLAAYLVLVEHLGLNTDLETLCWVLGSLALQQLRHFHDRRGLITGLVHAAGACERMAGWIPPEVHVTLISQIAHRLWWSRHGLRLHPVFTSLDPGSRPFAQALGSGDLTIAQRSARALAAEPARFWHDLWAVIADQHLADTRSLADILAITEVVAFRAGDGQVGSDDAAALACHLAACTWRRNQAAS